MSSEGIIPPILELPSTLPQGIYALRRRFIAPSTNVSTAGPDDYVNIYPDTSTPGSFLDPSSCYFQADLQILNANPFVDYQNFGTEGALGAIIQDYRVYNQGSILEEILEYGTVGSTLGTISGGLEMAFSMYFSNRLNSSYQTEMHKNFIKPPMCDAEGNIMFGPNAFGLGYDTTNAYSGQYLISAYTTAAGGTACSVPIMTAVGMPGSSSAIPVPVASTYNTLLSPPYTYTSTARLAQPSWANFSTSSPMSWPDTYDPQSSTIVEDAYTLKFGTINKPMIMGNLTNVKCYPIGCKSGVNAWGGVGRTPASVYDNGLPSTNPIPTNPVYRITAPIISGIFGILATKMLATCLLSPQQMYINLHLASASVALTLSSDPCRRIVGSVRDYVRNVGSQNKTQFGLNTFIPLTTQGYKPGQYGAAGSTCAPGYTGYNIIPSTVSGNSIYNIDSCTGRYKPEVQGSYVGDFTSIAGAANQCEFTTAADPNVYPGNFIGPCAAFPNGTFISGVLVAAAGGATSIRTTEPSVIAAPFGPYQVFGAFANTNVATPATPQYMLAYNPWKLKGTGTAAGVNVSYAYEGDCFYGTYLPYSVPQTARIFQLTYNSTTTDSYSLANVYPYSASKGEITYQINNIALVGDQIILPDTVTSDIIKQAAVGGFNVTTNSIRTYVMQPSGKSSTQSIICPLKVSAAKRLFLVFQPTVARSSNTGMLYYSNCGYNIFGNLTSRNNSVTATKSSIAGFRDGSAGPLYGVGFADALEYSPTKVNTTGNSMSVQLRIGNEFYPQQPITTMQELTAEYIKTLDGWGDNSFSPNSMGPIVTVGGEMVYDCLSPNKFTTIFIPQEFLDDQTITCNYDMAPLYSYTGTLAAEASSATVLDPNVATPVSSLNGYNWLAPRGYCTKGIFCSPQSSFLLAFDLSSFHESQGVSSWSYLGNNVITLLLNGAEALNNSFYQMRIVAVVPHKVVMRYSAGGQVIWNY